MKKSIQYTYFFEHSPEIVWEYLTKPELMEQWLMPSNFQPTPGHDFQFRTNPMPAFEFDGNIYCKVLEIDPLKKLSYSWKGGPGNGITTMDTIVEWTLTPENNGTSLYLNHYGFEETVHLPVYPLMQEGWKKNIHKINELIKKAQHDTANA